MPTTMQSTRPYFLEKFRVREGQVLTPGGLVVATPPSLKLRPQVVLFDGLAIIDTANHDPLVMVDLSKADPSGSWMFDVWNDHNQILTFNVIAALTNDPASAGLTGNTGTIAAVTREPIINDTWAPFVGIRVNYAVAPTTGQLTIRAQVRVFE